MAYNASSIQVLEGLEPVRKRPGMYIGSTTVKGLNHLVYEIVDNSVDESLAGYCSEITVTLRSDGGVGVLDNGRGIPVDLHSKGVPAERVIMTTLHAGGKFDNTSYKTSGGLHGVGSSVVNALSKLMIVRVYKDGKIYEDSYEYGKPTTALVEKLLPVVGKTKRHGTEVIFYPDDTIFETVRFKASSIEQRLHETAYLNAGLTLTFINERDGKEPVVFHETDGIAGFVRELTKEKEQITDVISFHTEKDNMQLDCAFCYTNDFDETLLGYCNNINTVEGGTHIAGFKTAFTKLINQYARELGILKEKDANFTGADTRHGITAIISLRHPEPRFEGQTKTKLDNTDVTPAVAFMTTTECELYFDRNVEVLKTVIGCAQKAASLRKAEEKTRANLPSKLSLADNGKLAKQESNKAEECEIFIVEGDSAGGSAKVARNRLTQAVLPIRGKTLNVEKAGWDKVMANKELVTMIVTFGTGIQDNFDISKLKYDKIIIMADADVDGAHIATLLLTFFYRFMPELIVSGHVYVAVPPLYKVEGKKSDIYLYSDKELEQYRKKHPGNITLQRYKGLGEMDSKQLWETTMNPQNRVLKKIEISDAAEASAVVSLLMGSEVEPRKNYIFEHGSEAAIDI